MPYRKPIIAPPWVGWNDSAPGIVLPNNSANPFRNWMINKGVLSPISTLTQMADPGARFLSGKSFRDILTNWHTVFFSQSNPYYLTDNPMVPYSVVTDTDGNGFFPQTLNPFSFQVYNNRLYFANGGNLLAHIDGDANFFLAGDTPSSCLYLGSLAAHLLQIFTIEVAPSGVQTLFPSRIRYSASGNGDEWDEDVDETAGLIDLTDINDFLTGWATINNIGFAFHQTGIITFTPTGVALDPFYVENYSIGGGGIGCFYPYTLAVYGTFAVFVGENDVYMFQGSGAPMPIGGAAKKQIFADIKASQPTITNFNSQIIGYVSSGDITIPDVGDYLSYWLILPNQVTQQTSVWVYNFDDKTWMNFVLPYGQGTFMDNLILG